MKSSQQLHPQKEIHIQNFAFKLHREHFELNKKAPKVIRLTLFSPQSVSILQFMFVTSQRKSFTYLYSQVWWSRFLTDEIGYLCWNPLFKFVVTYTTVQKQKRVSKLQVQAHVLSETIIIDSIEHGTESLWSSMLCPACSAVVVACCFCEYTCTSSMFS